MDVNIKTKQTGDSLETEIKKFANSLPYWAKFLAEKKLSGSGISDADIESSYLYLLEELQLVEESGRPEILINYNPANAGNYKSDLSIKRLENVEGVNALIEKQTIEFNPNLTVIYGANGTGKSGYTRLLKKVFYSKSPEEILHNVHDESGRKPVNATFTFHSNNADITLTYADRENSEFEQFAVFDGKSVMRQLDQKNEFEFRPAGLDFFAEYAGAINKLEHKLNAAINAKSTGSTASDLSELFDGDSEIKSFVRNLNAETKMEDMQKFIPFSNENKKDIETLRKEYDELLLVSKGKEKELKNLESIKKILGENKQAIEKLNSCLSTEYLSKINNAVADCLSKELILTTEGIEGFKTEKITGIGTTEWKNFIAAAELFAAKQKPDKSLYPVRGDNCLLCHQSLPDESQRLIRSYWAFMKSIAEENARMAQEILDKLHQAFEKFNFDLFPVENTFTSWLAEKYPQELDRFRITLSKQKTLCQSVIEDVQNKLISDRLAIQVNVSDYAVIETAIENSIKLLQEDRQDAELEKLLKSKIFLEHKEKFNRHFSKLEDYVNNAVWRKKASKANFAKRKITDTEKNLSDKYFNQKYVDAFNAECQKLSGSFGIDISYTGSGGKSYRQLKLKGRNPNVVLSEGEQKVIAIADFLAEMHLSEINRGVIFDDPVTSLDETRKSEIAKRLVQECIVKQTIIFTHDLVFLSSLVGHCSDLNAKQCCHWIESSNGQPGHVWLNNSPSYEKEYRNAEPAKRHYAEAKKNDCPPMQRESLLKSGFAALRTSYEVLVINDLFKNVVQRFNERVSIDALKDVNFNNELIEELQDSFAQCCRYMEGHTHSDKYAYSKPVPNNLNDEIQRFEGIKTKIKKTKKV
ncbi:MAG: AAA family ATPase [Opitutaceae bacterium]|nr:AAA family ATPase [Cytophagales bacterium]